MKRLILAFLFLLTHFSFAAKAQQPCALSVQGAVKNTSCQGGMDGTIHVQVTGGASPYSYIWSNGEEGTSVSQLTEGTYTVNVRDRNGCVVKKNFKVKTGGSRLLDLKVEQLPAGAGRKTLRVTFGQAKKPYAINIQKLSDGIRAPWNSYNGQELTGGIYTLEAFTEAGCSQIVRVIIDAN